MNPIEIIECYRCLGYDEGVSYIKENGLESTKHYAKQISDNQSPTLEEYGRIDGFLNAVSEML